MKNLKWVFVEELGSFKANVKIGKHDVELYCESSVHEIHSSCFDTLLVRWKEYWDLIVGKVHSKLKQDGYSVGDSCSAGFSKKVSPVSLTIGGFDDEIDLGVLLYLPSILDDEIYMRFFQTFDGDVEIIPGPNGDVEYTPVVG